MKRPSRKPESRSGASRKSSADRDGGVSTTIRSHRPVLRASLAQLAELLHRHVLLRARERAETARRRTGWPGSARPSRGWPGSRRPRRRCASCRASSRRGEPPLAGRRPGTGRGVLSSFSMPIDCASRRAGSMVSTTTLRPRSAARSARAADGGGLADAAGAAADDDLGARVVEQGVDVEVRRASPGARGERADARRLAVSRSCSAIPCSRRSCGELVEPAEVDAVGEPGQLVDRRRRASSMRARCSSSSARRSAWSRGLGEEPVERARR